MPRSYKNLGLNDKSRSKLRLPSELAYDIPDHLKKLPSLKNQLRNQHNNSTSLPTIKKGVNLSTESREEMPE